MSKIILIGPMPPPINGMSKAFSDYCKNSELLKKYKYKIIDISKKPKQNQTGLFNLSRTKDSLGFYLDFIKTISRRDIVYITVAQSKYGFLKDFFFLLISLAYDCKFIIHIHGGNYNGFYKSQSKFMKSLINFFIKKTDKIILLCDDLVNMFDVFDQKLIADKIRVVSNGVDSSFKKNKFNETKNIIYLSNLIEGKGYIVLLKAIDVLVNKLDIKGFKVSFYGAFKLSPDDKLFDNIEDYKKYFSDFVIKNKLQEYIDYYGVVSDDSKKDFILREADIFVLPTNYINEGQPISLIEAQAYSIPTVTTKYRGNPSVVKDNESGILLKSNSEEELADAIKKLLTSDDLMTQYSKNAYNNYQNNFTMDIYCKKLDDVINECILNRD